MKDVRIKTMKQYWNPDNTGRTFGTWCLRPPITDYDCLVDHNREVSMNRDFSGQ